MEGSLEGAKIPSIIRITHIFFVDDVLLIGRRTLGECQVYEEILDLFCDAKGMNTSEVKSFFLVNGIDEETLSQISQLFPYYFNDLSARMKYLWYVLKPCNYLTK